MIKQSSFNEYQNFGKYIDDVRRAKKKYLIAFLKRMASRLEPSKEL